MDVSAMPRNEIKLKVASFHLKLVFVTLELLEGTDPDKAHKYNNSNVDTHCQESEASMPLILHEFHLNINYFFLDYGHKFYGL